MKKAKLTLLISYLLSISIAAYSAMTDNSGSPKIVTPNAGSLGQYGQVPVNLYNGLPEISVPIYTIQTRSLMVPIALKYYAGGNRVDDHPGWVGLGWSLHAGGVITRITNGINDEANKSELSDLIGVGVTNNYFGYYYCSDSLSNDSWYNSFLARYVSPIDASTYQIDAEPDEFLVTCDGFSASLYLYKTSGNNIAVKIKSKDGQVVKAEVVFDVKKINLTDKNSNKLTPKSYNTFSKFKLRTSNGTQYIFGDNDNAIDFSISVKPSLLTNKSIAIPTSWYLTEIVSPVNDTIRFNYAKENVPAVESRCRYSSIIKNYEYSVSSYTSEDRGNSEYSYSLLYPSHLTDIQWNNGGKITFTTSPTHELSAISNPYELLKQVTTPLAGDGDFDYSSLNYYLKLDQIDINNQLRFNFNYTDTLTQRLRLLSLTCTDKNSLIQSSYLFGYNQTKLPVYNSKETDNWGYYNGKDYSYKSFRELYKYRTPNADFMQAEMLDTIIYPTGGKVIFEYEPHSFSKIVNYQQNLLNVPFELKDSTSIAGGLRIKKIKTQLNHSNISNIKYYEYKNADPDQTSSGILSNIPIYTSIGGASHTYEADGDNISYDYTFMDQSEKPVNWLDRSNGNQVTYSRVIEKLDDNSKTIFSYSNYKDFPDLTPLGIYGNFSENALETKFTSRDLERGLLTKTEYYNSNGLLVKKDERHYNNDISRYNNYIKSIYRYEKFFLVRGNAIPIYTFYPYLKSQEIVEYNTNTQDSILQQTYYTYDTNNLVKEIKKKTSTGDILRTVVNYSGNYTVEPYIGMTKRFIIGVPIETINYLNDAVIQGSLNIYKQVISSTDTMYLPDKSYSLENRAPSSSFTPFNGTIKDNCYSTPNIEFIHYDNRGNIREVKDRTGLYSTYLWGYNYEYPIAEIKNATYSQVLNALGLTSVDTQLSAFPGSNICLINTLRSLLPNSMVNTYTYRPNIGMSTATQPRAITTRYAYDTSNRLALIYDNNQSIVNCYNYAFYNSAEGTVNDYSALSEGTIALGMSQYHIDSIGSATCNISGGSGDYTYKWSLKNSSNVVLQSNLNVLSKQFSFVCSQEGTLALQCVVKDNQTEETRTINQSLICIDPCASCKGNMYKCINGICEEGVKTYISCNLDITGLYVCVYVYTFSDDSCSPEYTVRLKNPPPMV